jgi:hypothetical protein
VEAGRQPTAIMCAIMELILANEESVKKSDRLLSAWAKKREQARLGVPQTRRAPLWLKLSEDRSRWLVLEDRARVVRRIFALAAQGGGGYRMAARFNLEGVAPLEDRPYWTQRAITRVLSNRSVLGEFQPQRKVDGKVVDDGPPVPDYFRDKRTRAWVGIPLEGFIGRLVDLRKQYKKQKGSGRTPQERQFASGMDLMLKNVINTLYGDTAARYFAIGNTCPGRRSRSPWSRSR